MENVSPYYIFFRLLMLYPLMPYPLMLYPPTVAESMPPPKAKGKGKALAVGEKSGGTAETGGDQVEDQSFAEVVSEHSKKLEELRARQQVCYPFRHHPIDYFLKIGRSFSRSLHYLPAASGLRWNV